MKTKYYIKNVNGLNIPFRANQSDAGYDVIATSAPKIVGDQLGGNFYKRIDYIEYETNLYIAPEGRFHTDLRPRSSISKYNLVLANSVGLIDAGYRNQILVRFKYVWQPEDYVIENGAIMGAINVSKIYNHGDKICQLVPMETHDIDFFSIDKLDNNDRGGGFGSTDNKPKTQDVPKQSTEFVLGRNTSVRKFWIENGGSVGDQMELIESNLGNYSGEIYEYTENNLKGLCVVDYSGTILTKVPLVKK